MVGPEVAAAAAQKALEVLLEEDDPPAQQPTEATDKPEEAAGVSNQNGESARSNLAVLQ